MASQCSCFSAINPILRPRTTFAKLWLALKPKALELKFAECSDLQHLGGCVDVLGPTSNRSKDF